MTKNTIFISFLILIIALSCNSESCKIDYAANGHLYREAQSIIYQLDLDLNGENNGWDLVLGIDQNDSIVDAKIFDEIEKIELHRDSTILFQAPNCEKASPFRDVVYVLAYSPKGSENLKKKRNIGDIDKLENNWYLIEHINSLAN